MWEAWNEASAVHDVTKLGRSLHENKATHCCSDESALASHTIHVHTLTTMYVYTVMFRPEPLQRFMHSCKLKRGIFAFPQTLRMNVLYISPLLGSSGSTLASEGS